jgi:hypothetical protein
MNLLIVSTVKTGFLYDFTVDGGAVGTINTPIYLPAGVFARAKIETLVAFTSGGAATIAVNCGGQPILEGSPLGFGDTATINKGEDIATANGSANALINALNVAGGQVTLVIAGAALTAGKANFIIEYNVYN